MYIDCYITSSDCEKCICSHVASIGWEYEEHEWQCTKGYRIEGHTDNNSKPCGLKKGQYY